MLNFPPLFTLFINNQTLLATTCNIFPSIIITLYRLVGLGMSSFVAYLFLCFALMHACSGRPLGMFDDNKENDLLISAKGAKLSIKEEFSVEEKLQVENGASISLANGDGAVSMAETIEAFKKIDDQEDKGGNEGSHKRARSTLESPSAQRTKEDVNTTGDNDRVEDAVVMDYAQPHRKPPIHNR